MVFMYIIDLCFFISLICIFLLPIFAVKRGWGFLSNQSQGPDPDSCHYLNFTIQSIQTGLPERLSTKTFAGCMSSRYKRLEI